MKRIHDTRYLCVLRKRTLNSMLSIDVYNNTLELLVRRNICETLQRNA